MDRWARLKNYKSLARFGQWGALAVSILLALGFLTGTLLDGFSSAPAQQTSLQNPIPPPLKGMALGLFSQEPQYSYLPSLDEIHALGVNAILIMIPWYQKDIRDTKMEPRWGWNTENITLPDKELKSIVDRAHALGMKVLFMPYLRFDHRGAREWRGVLKPENLAEWQKNYNAFILYYALLAQSWGVEYLSVGSELGTMEKEEVFWEGLIKNVREKYQGKLLYSANWDHYTLPAFWKDLDAIGISSYNRLTKKNNPKLEDLTKAWGKLKDQIITFQKQFPEKKLILTELGYPSLKGASRDPWNYFAITPTDPQEQALCYQAFIEAWNNTPQLEGVFWWVWFGPGGIEDRSYTPKGKPAAEILKKWYGGRS